MGGGIYDVLRKIISYIFRRMLDIPQLGEVARSDANPTRRSRRPLGKTVCYKKKRANRQMRPGNVAYLVDARQMKLATAYKVHRSVVAIVLVSWSNSS